MAVKISILPPRFRRPELIGRGGMGDIYRATDSVLGRVVAIKILAGIAAGWWYRDPRSADEVSAWLERGDDEP